MKILLLKYFLALKNHLCALRNKSPRGFILGAALLFFAIFGIYFALWEGLAFIISLGGLGTIIIKKIIFVLFLALFVMVGFSFAVVFYTLTFKDQETEYLLTLPLSGGKVLLYKFCQAFFFSACIPVLGIFLFFLAYSAVAHAGVFLPWASFFYCIPLLFISCFLGFVLILIVVRFINIRIFFLSCLVAAVIFLLTHHKTHTSYSGQGIFYFISEEVAFFGFSRIWFLPFSWAGHGLAYLEDGFYGKSFLYLANLWCLGFTLFCYIPSFFRLFIKSYYQRFVFGHKMTLSRDYLDIIISRFNFLPKFMRIFFIKDVKLFFREPALWFQFLVFFGILFFYFLNLQRFSYHLLELKWRNLLAFLNILSVLCITAAIGVRFVFPQWSIEGRNFWIIKLTPISLKKIFLEKFIYAFFLMVFISCVLIYISNQMLKVEDMFFRLTMILMVVASFSLASLSLGLGAYFADFKQDFYLAAIESFGGFVTLVVNFTYTFLTVFLFATITHLYSLGKFSNYQSRILFIFFIWVIVSFIISAITATIGLKCLEVKEY